LGEQNGERQQQSIYSFEHPKAVVFEMNDDVVTQ
jgi:hypothetical protein